MDAMEWPPTFDGAYTPPRQEEYWDRRAETMPPQDREAVVLSKLRRQLRYAYENSEFYRELWSGAPVDPANIRSLDDLRRLPILTKDDLRREQEAHPPFGRYLCIPQDQITRIQGPPAPRGTPPSLEYAETTGTELPRRMPASCGARGSGLTIPSSSPPSSAPTLAAGAPCSARSGWEPSAFHSAPERRSRRSAPSTGSPC